MASALPGEVFIDYALNEHTYRLPVCQHPDCETTTEKLINCAKCGFQYCGLAHLVSDARQGHQKYCELFNEVRKKGINLREGFICTSGIVFRVDRFAVRILVPKATSEECLAKIGIEDNVLFSTNSVPIPPEPLLREMVVQNKTTALYSSGCVFRDPSERDNFFFCFFLEKSEAQFFALHKATQRSLLESLKDPVLNIFLKRGDFPTPEIDEEEDILAALEDLQDEFGEILDCLDDWALSSESPFIKMSQNRYDFGDSSAAKLAEDYRADYEKKLSLLSFNVETIFRKATGFQDIKNFIIVANKLNCIFHSSLDLPLRTILCPLFDDPLPDNKRRTIFERVKKVLKVKEIDEAQMQEFISKIHAYREAAGQQSAEKQRLFEEASALMSKLLYQIAHPSVELSAAAQRQLATLEDIAQFWICLERFANARESLAYRFLMLSYMDGAIATLPAFVAERFGNLFLSSCENIKQLLEQKPLFFLKSNLRHIAQLVIPYNEAFARVASKLGVSAYLCVLHEDQHLSLERSL